VGCAGFVMACLLGRRVLVSTLVALLLCHVRGQIYSLDAVQAPINRSLEIAYQFYIYSWKDAPGVVEGSSDAYLKFHQVHAHSTEASQPDAKMAGYEAMQVGIMRQREFENTIDETDFCCTQENIDKKICNQVDQLMLKKAWRELRRRWRFYSYHPVSEWQVICEGPQD